jgi:D-sedoheptulose 7-phosphate isomerase
MSAEAARAAILDSLTVQERLLDDLHVEAMVRAAELAAESLLAGGRLLLFGNGGSAADATHIAAEFVGRFLEDRRSLPALSLSDNASSVTAIANDFGYENVFARQVEGLGSEGDVAVGISTSGRSPNVLAGLRKAREGGLATIGLTGGDGGPMAELCDVCITVPSGSTPRIQEGHALIGHVLCELVEQRIA